MAGQPIEALVNTSVYLALINSVSAASCPARNDSAVSHFCSNQISYNRVDGNPSTPVCTENLIPVDDVMESPKLAE
jgi:hypothetical protein